MAELDLSFCSRAEYRASESDRIIECELAIGSLYTVMYSLSLKGPYEAAIVPARVLKKTAQSCGQRILFAALDTDLQPTAHIHASFEEGYMSPILPGTHVSNQQVIGAYFKGYETGCDWNLSELTTALELAGSY